jgi:hypothetical protein
VLTHAMLRLEIARGKAPRGQVHHFVRYTSLNMRLPSRAGAAASLPRPQDR